MHYRSRMRWAILTSSIWAVLLMASCVPASAVPTVAVTVVTVVVPFTTPTATPACTDLLPGMVFTLTTQPNAVMIELSGLRPGEQPTLVLWHEVPGVGAKRIEGTALPVADDGRLVERQYNLSPADENAPNTWHIQVIHAQGVACTEVTIP